MLHANKLIPQGRGLAAVLLKRAASIELDWAVRSKYHFEATDSQGRHVGVSLPDGSVMRGGDVLVAEDGTLVRVLAAPQPVLFVRPCPQHGSAFDLLRAAYHLGSRQVPLQLAPDHLKLEPDPVLARLLDAMQLIVSEEQAAFEPEADVGAAQHAGHAHGDHHAHGHAHDHAQATPSPQPHVHGPGCGHGHGHGHDHHDHDHDR